MGSGPGEWWHAIGSDARYTPRIGWFKARDEQRAYAAGIRDAMRIFEKHAWQTRRRANIDSDAVKIALMAMHHRAQEFER